MREALLTIHAIADEACSGVGVALDSSDGEACVYRARGRELLARTGSLARVNPRVLRVLPKVRTPPTGRASFSRYACVHGPGIEARWHKMPARHPGTDVRLEYANLLLLPWPLEVKASDFRPLDEPVRRPTEEPFAFFEFVPLYTRGFVATQHDRKATQATGCTPASTRGWRRVRFQASRAPAGFHIRQHKHHRWSLDESQIYQYHLGGVLHPTVRWWEAIEVPRRAIEFVEVAELMLISLVCEDLAQYDDIAELVRSVGPTLVIAILLDGPQLTTRWAARYASVFADDPGSAVLTLTSFGMVRRSRPNRRDVSPVVALWRDPARGFREVPLETGAQGVVLTVCMDRATRRSADGRWPGHNGTRTFDVAVHQCALRAASRRRRRPASRCRLSPFSKSKSSRF